MRINLVNNKIIVICDDPIEYWDLSIQIQKLCKHYKEDHHYDE